MIRKPPSLMNILAGTVAVVAVSLLLSNIISLLLMQLIIGAVDENAINGVTGLTLQLLAFAAFIVVVIFTQKYITKGTLSAIGVRRGSFVVDILLTSIVSIVCIGSIISSLYFIFGASIDLQFVAMTPLILLFFGFIVQGIAEELLFRGYIQFSLLKVLSYPWAILVSSVLFTLLHLPNLLLAEVSTSNVVVGLINTLLFSIIVGYITYRTGRIWIAAVIHIVWNFTLMVLLSSPLSGATPLGVAVFTLVFPEGLSTLISGGNYGLEASVVSSALFVTIVIAMCIYHRIYQKPLRTIKTNN